MWRVVKHFLSDILNFGPVCLLCSCCWFLFSCSLWIVPFSLVFQCLRPATLSPPRPPTLLPIMGPASPAVRNSVHNPNCPIQQCPVPSCIKPPSPLSSPTWNSSYLSVSRLVLPNDTVFVLLFFICICFVFQLIKCNY